MCLWRGEKRAAGSGGEVAEGERRQCVGRDIEGQDEEWGERNRTGSSEAGERGGLLTLADGPRSASSKACSTLRSWRVNQHDGTGVKSWSMMARALTAVHARLNLPLCRSLIAPACALAAARHPSRSLPSRASRLLPSRATLRHGCLSPNPLPARAPASSSLSMPPSARSLRCPASPNRVVPSRRLPHFSATICRPLGVVCSCRHACPLPADLPQAERYVRKE